MAEDASHSLHEEQEDMVLGLYFEAEADILADTDTSDLDHDASDEDDDDDDNHHHPRSTTKKPSNKPTVSPNTPEPADTPIKEEEQGPPVHYETQVPHPSTIIAMIAPRRLDRLTPAQAQRTDVCLSCGQAGPASVPSNEAAGAAGRALHRLPCGHTWCSECLARTLLFAINNHLVQPGRLRCCAPPPADPSTHHDDGDGDGDGDDDGDGDIPLRYFEAIAQDRIRPPPQWEPQTGTQPTSSDSGGGGEEAGTTTTAATTAAIVPSLRDWNPIHVFPCVEQDADIYLTHADIAAYKAARREGQTLPKHRIYCPRTEACGSFISAPSPRRGKRTVTCPKCLWEVCLRCRNSPASHASSKKCTAGPARMEIVTNDRKLLVLARKKGWKRCPRCRIFVDKVKGACSSVICRCGHLFYYG